VTTSDAELLAAVLAGNTDSFRGLYDRYYSLAVGIARSRLIDVHLAEDAAQESFSIAYRTLASLQNPERFAQWLGTICRRTASRLADLRPLLQPLSDDAVGGSTGSDENELQQQLHESLLQLDETARELIMLHYFSDLTYDQISTVVPLTPQAIHGRLQRARRTLRTALQSKEKSE
jgi:RNA polymerase sigma-70 factor, ECF subfamily